MEEYSKWAERMSKLAETMPGHISHKGFVAEDGERITVVEFEDEASQRNWRINPEHIAAQRKGRQDFYSEYCLQVCRVERTMTFSAKS